MDKVTRGAKTLGPKKSLPESLFAALRKTPLCRFKRICERSAEVFAPTRELLLAQAFVLILSSQAGRPRIMIVVRREPLIWDWHRDFSQSFVRGEPIWLPVPGIARTSPGEFQKMPPPPGSSRPRPEDQPIWALDTRIVGLCRAGTGYGLQGEVCLPKSPEPGLYQDFRTAR